MENDQVRKTEWEPMSLREVGDIEELVLAGGGKSGTAADPGDVLKPPGQS